MTDGSDALQTLLDRAAIEDLLGAYAEAADRGRSAELAELFIADGVLEILGESFDAGRHAGREAIVARLERTRAEMPATEAAPLLRHHLATIRIRFATADAARVDAYFLAVTGSGPDHWGRYSDQVVHTAAGWRFAHRKVIHEGHAVDSWLRRQLDRLFGDQPLG